MLHNKRLWLTIFLLASTGAAFADSEVNPVANGKSITDAKASDKSASEKPASERPASENPASEKTKTEKSASDKSSAETKARSDSKTSAENGSWDPSHKLFTADLKKYVHNGLIDYKTWKRNPDNLNLYLEQLKSLTADQYKTLSLDAKKALWINAYNAFTISIVLKNYPIKGTNKYYPEGSLRQIEDVWDNSAITIGGRKVTIDQLEHGVLRKDFRDPRVHFAVVCAAKDGGKIRSEAFTARGIDRALEEVTKTFMQNPRNVQFDLKKNVVYASKIFNWFALDFAKAAGIEKFGYPPPSDEEVVLKYLILRAPSAVKNRLTNDPAKRAALKLVYAPYDWSLNEYFPGK